MVCLYCGSPTKVTNSRPQIKSNQIWRRRQCIECGGIMTSHETYEFDGTLLFKLLGGKPVPFKKEKLFLSILKTCEHRPTALDDAIALTQTIMGRILGEAADGVVTAQSVAKQSYNALKNFDHAAAVQYAAYHAEFSYGR